MPSSHGDRWKALKSHFWKCPICSLGVEVVFASAQSPQSRNLVITSTRLSSETWAKGWQGRRSNPAHPHGHPVWRSGRSAPLPYPPDGYRQDYHIYEFPFNGWRGSLSATNAPRFSAFSDHAGGGILSFCRGCVIVPRPVWKKFFPHAAE